MYSSGILTYQSFPSRVMGDMQMDNRDFRTPRSPLRADFRPEIAELRPERAVFRPARADFRSEKAWGGQKDGWTKKSTPVFYRTSSPLGPLPFFLSLQFTIMQSRAMGIADRILPLGDLLVPGGH